MTDRIENERKCILERRGYCMEGLAGQGAFSLVYRVRRRKDGLLCACKISRERRQWERETAFLWRVRDAGHPLFPQIYDSWQEDGECFLVMEYVSGQGLGKLMHVKGRLAQEQAVFIGIRLAEGLAFLEEREGMLYRDLKPENVKVCENGEVKLLDFGCICSKTKEGGKEAFGGRGHAGTPGYAAPEQLDPRGEVGEYSDVYAFGRLLHYLLTGDNPYLPPARKPPIRSYDRSLSRVLEGLLEECVRLEGKERLPDMRCVLRRLKRLHKKGSLRYAAQELCALWRGRKPAYLYEKNILSVTME